MNVSIVQPITHGLVIFTLFFCALPLVMVCITYWRQIVKYVYARTRVNWKGYCKCLCTKGHMDGVAQEWVASSSTKSRASSRLTHSIWLTCKTINVSMKARRSYSNTSLTISCFSLQSHNISGYLLFSKINLKHSCHLHESIFEVCIQCLYMQMLVR